MKASESDLMERLAALSISVTTERHEPVFTVDDTKSVRSALPGGHCKSLFLKDKKGAYWLVVALEDTQVDLKTLQKKLGAARLSFARAERLDEILGVEPGSVTPFALINETASVVTVVLEAAMLEADLLNYHPLHNRATSVIRPDDLLAFIRASGHEPRIMAF
ncbi:MAG: prolyl-tRNA synthetase associated domain-containing protein [Rhodospirillales bacterium]|jgi:Ala-tRNA(Pro) deacylase|nr:prolyl-tRNA synthetase associated domain-containing protein [Rhodospirillales bacterium]